MSDNTQDEANLNKLQTLLVINKAYQEAIDEKLESLEKKLLQNMKQQVLIKCLEILTNLLTNFFDDSRRKSSKN
jgi:hypothetical protein